MIYVCLGIGLLLSGIFIMRYGLKKALWYRLRIILKQTTKTPFRALVLGTVSAAVLQSSTTVCLITIGLVGSEYMSFNQALGVILGANIGTCSTVQLVNLSLPLNLLLPALLGSLLLSLFKRLRYFCLAIAGLLCMLAGLVYLTDGIAALSEMSQVHSYIRVAQSNPLYAIWGGLLITLAFQSSSAATACLMLFISEGFIDLTTAAYVVYGNNIGSCISSVIFSAAAPLAARRVALSHILLNVFGAALFFPLTGILVSFAEIMASDLGNQVAALHLLFNVLSSLIAFLLLKPFTRLIYVVIPDRYRQ